MSVKKRISSILLAMALMLMLAACGSESGEIGKKDQATGNRGKDLVRMLRKMM